MTNKCDGIGGTVRRLARKVSLQNPYEQQAAKPTQLYEWAIVKTLHYSSRGFLCSVHPDNGGSKVV
jgi:hypothetical protein